MPTTLTSLREITEDFDRKMPTNLYKTFKLNLVKKSKILEFRMKILEFRRRKLRFYGFVVFSW